MVLNNLNKKKKRRKVPLNPSLLSENQLLKLQISQILKRIKSKRLLKFVKKNIRAIKRLKSIYSLRRIYLSFSESSKKERDEFRDFFHKKAYDLLSTYIDIRAVNQLLLKPKRGRRFNLYKFFVDNYQLSNLHYFKNRSIKLFIVKFANLLMRNGEKRTVMKIILKFFEILQRDFSILDSISILQEYLYFNLIPAIKPKTVGFRNKKIIGISLPIYKRISTSFKLFVEGARMHRLPIVYGLIKEFFNFFTGKTLLQQTNKKILGEISEHSLYKYVQIDSDMITPEKYYGNSLSQVTKYPLAKMFLIDWENYDNILTGIYKVDLQKKMLRQNLLVYYLKFHVIDKYIQKPNVIDPYPKNKICNTLKKFPPKNLDGTPILLKKPKVNLAVYKYSSYYIRKSYFNYIVYSNIPKKNYNIVYGINKKKLCNDIFKKKIFHIGHIKEEIKRFVKTDKLLIILLNIIGKKWRKYPQSLYKFFNLCVNYSELDQISIISMKKYIKQNQKFKYIMQTYVLTDEQKKRWYELFSEEIQKRAKISLSKKDIFYLFTHTDTSKYYLHLSNKVVKDIPSNRVAHDIGPFWLSNNQNKLMVDRYNLNVEKSFTDNVKKENMHSVKKKTDKIHSLVVKQNNLGNNQIETMNFDKNKKENFKKINNNSSNVDKTTKAIVVSGKDTFDMNKYKNVELINRPYIVGKPIVVSKSDNNQVNLQKKALIEGKYSIKKNSNISSTVNKSELDTNKLKYPNKISGESIIQDKFNVMEGKSKLYSHKNKFRSSKIDNPDDPKIQKK
jgi:hypothetical protein